MALSKALFSIAFISASTPAFAATQGTVGPTSTGTININASITPEVNIANLDDITFSNPILRIALNTGNDAIQVDQVCVWSNNVDGSYYLTATGSGAANAMTLTDGTNVLNYDVFWRDSDGTTQQLVAGTKSTQFASGGEISPDCAGGTNSVLSVTIDNAEITTMEASTTYNGVLTFLVTPS